MWDSIVLIPEHCLLSITLITCIFLLKISKNVKHNNNIDKFNAKCDES